MKEEYTQTRFIADGAPAATPSHFLIVTAFNPFGERTTDAENRKMTEALLRRIQESGWKYFAVTGRCEDHAEDGFGIECSRVDALKLGREFRQDAIYEVLNDEVILVDCAEEVADRPIGHWSALRLLP